jgi:CheY-like chemotaxis protein
MSTVLVVDDEPHIVHAIEAVLRKHGHRLLFADNAEQAFRLACTWLSDTIVTDRDMPGVDVLALCEEPDRYPASAQIPAITISGREWPALQLAPWTMYLGKPINPVVLEAAVESLAAQPYWREPGPQSLPDRATSR